MIFFFFKTNTNITFPICFSDFTVGDKSILFGAKDSHLVRENKGFALTKTIYTSLEEKNIKTPFLLSSFCFVDKG